MPNGQSIPFGTDILTTLPLAGRRVLLVEDRPTDQRLLALWLTRAGACVDLECNGRAAVDRLYPRFGSATPVDAVVMDLLMSPMDGAEATEVLRGRGFLAPVLVLTGSTVPEDETRCVAAGCDRFLVKPVSNERLVAALAECIVASDRGRRAS